MTYEADGREQSLWGRRGAHLTGGIAERPQTLSRRAGSNWAAGVKADHKIVVLAVAVYGVVVVAKKYLSPGVFVEEVPSARAHPGRRDEYGGLRRLGSGEAGEGARRCL